jgi:hypothetical protein
MSSTLHATVTTDALRMVVKRDLYRLALYITVIAVWNMHVMHIENFSRSMA